MDAEVGRGVGVSSTWSQAGAGTADPGGAPGRGEAGAVSLSSVGQALTGRPRASGQGDTWVVQATTQGSPSLCCQNPMLF